MKGDYCFSFFSYQIVYFLVIKYTDVNIIYLNTLSSKKQEQISVFLVNLPDVFN